MSLSDDIISRLVDTICFLPPISVRSMYDSFLAETERLILELETSECYTSNELAMVRERVNQYSFVEFIQHVFQEKQKEEEGRLD